MRGVPAVQIHVSLWQGWSRRLYRGISDPTRRSCILCRLKGGGVRFRYVTNTAGTLTSRPLVNLVLDEEIYHRDYGYKESELGHENLIVNSERIDKRCSDVFPSLCE